MVDNDVRADCQPAGLSGFRTSGTYEGPAQLTPREEHLVKVVAAGRQVLRNAGLEKLQPRPTPGEREKDGTRYFVTNLSITLAAGWNFLLVSSSSSFSSSWYTC